MNELMNSNANSNNYRVFNHPLFGDVRVLTEDGKPLFCGVDIAKPLGYQRERDAIRQHCKGAVKRRALTGGGEQEMTFIPESDVMRLITHSRLPEAEKFERWVFDEVLPQINHMGVYAQTPEALTAAFLQSLTANPRGILALVEQNVLLQEENLAQKKQLAEQAPKVEKHDQLMSVDGGILMKELAGYLTQNGAMQLSFKDGVRKKMGQNNLYAWMRENGYLCRASGERYNIPVQKYIDQGLFVLKAAVVDISGTKREVSTTLVTPKGQSYFLDLFIKKFAVITAF